MGSIQSSGTGGKENKEKIRRTKNVKRRNAK